MFPGVPPMPLLASIGVGVDVAVVCAGDVVCDGDVVTVAIVVVTCKVVCILASSRLSMSEMTGAMSSYVDVADREGIGRFVC
ncbi:hypothetical protein BDP81DRAFT_435923 [Colletotrichum phormii]|uniref:Uncharacterized protein n=1 Tax=Colletotrichum phormii TaxID=359342 RepID=A0AAI9ZJ01_9PEZI|nr:uncharacterized protein BDP81DRAFT_435923 [Colletotrichum phormii]KAK1625493.1 hypothetical protein BDP81DRAFT_435923 [Colletotrichum phormii]